MNAAPTLHCPCDGVHLQTTFTYEAPPPGETRFDLGSASYHRQYRCCGVCGHWFARHKIDLSHIYVDTYVSATYGGLDGMGAKLKAILSLPPERSDNAGRVAAISTFAERRFGGALAGRSVLDVGAGLGVFPSVMKSLGWRPTGIELDRRAAEHLRSVVGIDAHAEDLFDLAPERTGLFDLVTFNKVLEHVDDPVRLLERGGAFLASGGFVYFEVPDTAAAVEGPDREEFFLEHIHVFAPASVAMLADRAGFSLAKIERLREPSGKFTLRAFLVTKAEKA